MEKNKISTQPNGASRAAYEAPAIEASASFERLVLACAHTPAEVAEDGCRDMMTGLPAPDS